MYRLISSKYFDRGILMLIVISSIKLVWDTYYINNDENTDLSYLLDIIFTAIFLVECIIKIIAIGFFYEQGTYLRDNWNILDFIIVVISIIEISVANVDLSVIKIFRLLRTLRPLRFISHNESMRLVVMSLMQSLVSIFNV
mmetsp:Transcript_2312/g.281  ORF Transcript_2312/g.281 Transcript_2312/m.281 type:complete len:141 (+) Transcript_2312:102-524(+)